MAGLALDTDAPGLGLSPKTTLDPIDQAHKDLNLTPQERVLYSRHLENLNGPGKVEHPDGSISTLYQMTFGGPDGRFYNVPTVYNGSIVSPQEAWQKAMQYGLHFFPSYPDQQTAEARYQAMHRYMEQDTMNWIKHNRRKR